MYIILVHLNLLFKKLNIRFIQIWTNFETCIWGLTGIVICCFRTHLTLLWCVVLVASSLALISSSSFVMHHAWLCIMSCICVVCLLCCVLLLDSSCFVAIVRICSSTLGSSSWLHLLQGFVLLPCGISGKMTATLDLTTIVAMLVASFYRFAALPITCLSSLPKLPWTSNLWHLSYANRCLAMLLLLLSPLIALLVAGEVEDFSMVDRILVGISQYLLYY